MPASPLRKYDQPVDNQPKKNALQNDLDLIYRSYLKVSWLIPHGV